MIQELVDYIKKAKVAGQSNDQTRALLYKNGWTETEVSEAYASLSQPISVQPQQQPQPQPQPQSSSSVLPQQTRPQSQGPDGTPQQSQVAAGPNGYPAQYNMPRAKKSHLASKLLIVLIILIILGAVGYFIAGQYLNLPWNIFKPSPQAVVGKMLENMKNVKSSQTKIQLDIDALGEAGVSQGKLSFSAEGGSDTSDSVNAKIKFTFTMDATIPGSAAIPDSYAASAEAVGLGDALYFKLNSFGLPSVYSPPGVDISEFVGKWFKMDQDSIKTLMGAQGGQAEIPDISQLSAGNLEYYKKLQGLISADTFSNYSKLQDQIVNGQDTHHYLLTMTKDKLKSLMAKMMELQMQEAARLQGNNEALNVSLVQNMAQALMNTLADALGDINIEVWIGKKDYLLYQTKIAKTIDLSKAFPGVDAKIDFKFSATNSDFNKPITVQEPQDFQKIETIILPLLKVQKISADMNQIGVIARNVFSANNSFSSLCNRGLLNGYLADYGETLVDLNSDIVGQGGKKPVCFGATSGFCVSTQLEDGGYVCIDEGGVLGNLGAIRLGTTRCMASTTVCQ